MSRASGAIVAVRDDVAVGDARWLETYRAVLPLREISQAPATESVVLETMVAGQARLADGAVKAVAADSAARTASVGMAAAV